MKKIVLAAAISLSILSCKKEVEFDYKHSEKPATIACDNVDVKLLSEAYYVFENAIMIQAENTKRRPQVKVTIDNAMRSYINRTKGNIKITDYITEESLAIFNILKNQDIWEGAQLKSNSTINECIAKGISNKGIKSSFNTLLSIESLDPKLIASAITDNRGARGQFRDKTLMTYVALDMYYAKFFNTDFSNLTFLTEKAQPTAVPTPKITPKTPQIGKALDLDVKKKKTEAHGPNDGHNH